MEASRREGEEGRDGIQPRWRPPPRGATAGGGTDKDADPDGLPAPGARAPSTTPTVSPEPAPHGKAHQAAKAIVRRRQPKQCGRSSSSRGRRTRSAAAAARDGGERGPQQARQKQAEEQQARAYAEAEARAQASEAEAERLRAALEASREEARLVVEAAAAAERVMPMAAAGAGGAGAGGAGGGEGATDFTAAAAAVAAAAANEQLAAQQQLAESERQAKSCARLRRRSMRAACLARSKSAAAEEEGEEGAQMRRPLHLGRQRRGCDASYPPSAAASPHSPFFGVVVVVVVVVLRWRRARWLVHPYAPASGSEFEARLVDTAELPATAEAETAALRAELEAMADRNDAMSKMLDGVSEEDLRDAAELGVVREREQALQRENTELRRRLAQTSKGYHGDDQPWSPRLGGDGTNAIFHPRPAAESRRPVTADAAKAGADGADGRMDGGGGGGGGEGHGRSPASSSPGAKAAVRPEHPTARRMRQAEYARSQRWESRRAQLEHEREMQAERKMKAYCTVHYTGEACAEMHSLLYDAASEGASSRPSASRAASGAATHRDLARSPVQSPESEILPIGSLVPPKRGAIPLPSSRQRPSGAGRVSVLHSSPLQVAPLSPGSKMTMRGYQRSPRSASGLRNGGRGSASPLPMLSRNDSGLRPTSSLGGSASLPAL